MSRKKSEDKSESEVYREKYKRSHRLQQQIKELEAKIERMEQNQARFTVKTLVLLDRLGMTIGEVLEWYRQEGLEFGQFETEAKDEADAA